MICRKATFLSDDEWRHVPWTLYPKNAFHQYLDLAAEVPALLERADSFLQPWVRSSPQDHLRYLYDCVSMLARLQAWADKSNVRMPSDPSVLSPSVATLGSDSTVVKPHHVQQNKSWHHGTSRENRYQHCYPSKTPQDLGTSFDILQRSRLKYTSWGVQLVLYLSVYENSRLRKCFEESVRADGSLMGLSRRNATEIARSAAMWAEFCTQNAWQSFGPVFGVFIIENIVKWFEIDKEYECNRHDALHTSSDPSAASAGPNECRQYSHQVQLDECLDLLNRLPATKY